MSGAWALLPTGKMVYMVSRIAPNYDPVAPGVACGFVVAACHIAKALLDDNPNANEDEIKDAIAGNLCRCTGYVQIIDSIKTVSGYFKEEEPTVVAWKSEEGDRGE